MAILSVRSRLIVWNALVLALILMGSGVALRYRMQADLMAGLDQELASRARPFVTQRQPPPPPPGFAGEMNGSQGIPLLSKEGQGEVPKDNVNASTIQTSPQPSPWKGEGGDGRRDDHDMPPPPGPRPPRDMRILNPQGTDPMTGQSPFDAPAFQTSLAGEALWSTSTQGGDLWRIYSAPRRDKTGHIVGVVQTEMPLAATRAEIADLSRTLLTLIPLGLLAAIAGAAFLTTRALKPVQQIATTVDQIQAEDLSRRLPERGSDEFSRLSYTLNAMLGRLQSAFDKQRRFTMDASHELKTPLTMIKAKTSVALARPRSAEEYRATLQTVDAASDRMAKIVQDLLLLAQADGGQLGQERVATPVRALAQAALEGVDTTEGPKVQIEVPEPGPAARGNPAQIERVLRNLIENAVAHTPKMGSVSVRAASTPEGCEIVVCDTGLGVAPEHLPHLTERFYRVDSARSREEGGTGLGLAICQEIVQAHGGRLAIESELGMGTTVRVWLPA